MRILITTINAKYIHTNRAIRILTALAEPHFDVSFHEFTIKESIAKMVSDIQSIQPDVLAISTYIWNGSLFVTLCHEIKKVMPKLVIIAGGPEMSEAIDQYFNLAPIDYIVKGEAEEVFVPLLNQISAKEVGGLPGVATPTNRNVERLEVRDLSLIPDINHLYTDDDYAHRIIYLEASRGCPFHCSYCLASLSNHVRHFPFSYVQNDIQTMVRHNVQTLKYLDRTMNADPKRFLELCDYVSGLPQPISVQFEVSADILPPRVMDYLVNQVKANVVRLEIGVQSIHQDTLLAVKRPHQVKKTLAIIKQLIQGGRVVLHTDLIAGLPYETLDLFKQSFNEVFLTFSHELQLGFLKLLQGTLLREQVDLFGYAYDDQPPYEIKSTKWLTKSDIETIKKVEAVLDLLWNRKRSHHTLKKLHSLGRLDDPFQWFLELSLQPSFHERMPLVELYRLIQNYLMSKYVDADQFIDELKMDYIRVQPIKPIPFWTNHDELLRKYRELWLATHRTLEEWNHLTKIPLSKGLIVIHHDSLRRIEKISFE